MARLHGPEHTAENDARLDADAAPLGSVAVEAISERLFIRVADDKGTKWWVHTLPIEADGDSVWSRAIRVIPPGATDA